MQGTESISPLLQYLRKKSTKAEEPKQNQKIQLDIKSLKKVIARITNDSDELYFFRGVLPYLCFNNVIKLIDINMYSNSFILKLIIDYLVVNKLNIQINEYELLLTKVQNHELKLKGFYERYRAASLQRVILLLINENGGVINSFVKRVINSPNILFRKLGYQVLLYNFNIILLPEIESNWYKYHDYDIIDIVLEHRVEFVNSTLPKDMIDFLKPEEGEFMRITDLKKKSILSSILVMKDKNILNVIKYKEPITYISVCKILNYPIDKEVVINQYLSRKRTRRYLPGWLAEEGNYEVVAEIMDVLLNETTR